MKQIKIKHKQLIKSKLIQYIISYFIIHNIFHIFAAYHTGNTMSKYTSLNQLIQSLTKPERKKISSSLKTDEDIPDYMILYKLISESNHANQQEIKESFIKKRPSGSFNTAINYLFDTLLTLLSQLRTNQDSHFSLFNELMNAKVLYEKSIYRECFQLLTKIQNEAVNYENFPILFIAQKMELDYMLGLDFPELSEQSLLNKQFKTNETLKKIRKINEHASLYELLRHRILHKGNARSNKQKQEMNDLIISEMSIVSSSGFDNFEIQKNHKLFQSNYLISVGDYKSALNSFYELNNIFEQNMHLLSNPPVYYLNTIEGVLETLRGIKNYEGMNYFINQLKKLETNSIHFQLQINYVVFLYSLLPMIDTGDFAKARKFISAHREDIYDKINFLIPARQTQLLLYTSIAHLGNRETTTAKKIITRILQSDRKAFSAPVFRTARLINLMALYELNEFDFMDFEIRSVKREIQNKEKNYQIELLILKLLGKSTDSLSEKARSALYEKLKPQLDEIRNNKFELQLLRIFDFTAWIESIIKKIPLEAVLSEKSGTGRHHKS